MSRRKRKLAICASFIFIIVLLFVMIIYCLFKQNETSKINEHSNLTLKAADLVIEVPEVNTYGTITVYDENERVFSYIGEIDIKNDGTDGNEINIVVKMKDNTESSQ